jgi:two-component system cell cycle response regulator
MHTRPLDPSDHPQDPATRAWGGTLPEDGPGDLEWALIRYVGQPIGEVIVLPARGLSIGRSHENLLWLDHPEVSRNHARLDVTGDGGSVELRDLESTNGIFVNGRKVDARTKPVLLEQGDVLRIGGQAFKLKRLDPMERRFHEEVVAQTTVDPLTGVNSRAALLRQLERYHELAKRHQRPLSIILADLDRFKQVNDTYGHAAGDQVLRVFGGLLAGRLRGSDHVGRLGGEEFLLVLPETAAAMAVSVAQALRRSLEEVWIEHQGHTFRVTCSLGVAELAPGDVDGGALLARADVALYAAKAGGRNRTVLAP